MREHIHALELGGTLFVPASHKNLEAILSGTKYPDLRSVVIDFEDGLASADRPEAFNNLSTILENLKETNLLRFIRPPDHLILQELLKQNNIEKIDGFILPKFTLESAERYLTIIKDQKLKIKNLNIMPSIEGKELFNIQQLQELREVLTPYKKQIICIRFGAQDMLRQLGLRQEGSIYEMLAPKEIISNLIITFKPFGFDISAPVYPHFSDVEGFKKEVDFELQNGLISKTIIHPSQILPIKALYTVTPKEYAEANTLINQESNVINLHGSMGETPTQRPWAFMINRRKDLYGLR